MPDAPADRCALSVHYYSPAGFALLTKDASWSKASSTWGTDADYQELNYYIIHQIIRFDKINSI